MHRKTTSGIQKSFWDTLTSVPYLPQVTIFLFAFLLYVNTLSHDYTQDDAIVIYDNMFTTQGIEGIPGIISNDTFYGFFKEEGKSKLVAGGRYRPLTQIMFALEWELFGRNPFIGHLINILLYGFLVLLLFKCLLLLFRNHLEKNSLFLLAFVGALLFAVHPVHTEVVANIKGRDELMSLLLSLATLWLILKWSDLKKIIYLVWVFPVFLAALLSKENAITFVAAIPLALYMFRERSFGQQLPALVVLIITSGVFLLIRAAILGWDFGGNSMELMNNPFLQFVDGKYIGIETDDKFATIFYTLGKYIQLLFFPHPLTHDYYPRHIGIMNWGDWQVWLSLISYTFMGLFALLRMKRHRILSYGILFYMLTLSIVSNIVFPIGTNMSERFLFMPSVGFVIALVAVLPKIRKNNAWLAVIIVPGIISMLGFKTITRNQVWKDDFTLFTTDVKTSRNSAKVLNAAGGALVTKAAKTTDEFQKRKMLNEAVAHLKSAIEIHPAYKNAYLILGNAQFYLEKYTDAVATYEKVLDFAPGFEDALENLGIAHREAGKDYGMNKNDLSKALYHLKIALDMRPEDYETVRLYGIAQALSGNNLEALKAFEKGVELDPDNAGAFLNLGNVHHHLGNAKEALENRKKALELDPEILSNNNSQNQ
jgi:Flp pilus assembly protein TadD